VEYFYLARLKFPGNAAVASHSCTASNLSAGKKLVHRTKKVQECDATIFNSITQAGIKKICFKFYQ
jgi:hypothetical protein